MASSGLNSVIVFQFALCVLAVYRVAMVITMEEGPLGLFAWLQERTRLQRNWFERGMNCPICVSFWLSALAALTLGQLGIQYIVNWLAIAGAVQVLIKYLNNKR